MPKESKTDPWLCVALIILATMVTGCTVHAPPRERDNEHPDRSMAIAALPFRDSSPQGKYAPLAEAMGDLLVSFLAQAKPLVFVERDDLVKVLDERGLALSGLTRDSARAEVGRLLGARYILTGGVTVVGKEFKISAHLFEVETGRVVRSESAQGEVGELLTVVHATAQKLAKDLNLELPELKEEYIDKHPEANLCFMRGLGYYYGNMLDHAVAEFMRTLTLKPDHARARYWNGVCYFDSREYEHARIEFGRFLNEFPEHELAPKVREMMQVCNSGIQRQESGREGD